MDASVVMAIVLAVLGYLVASIFYPYWREALRTPPPPGGQRPGRSSWRA